MSIILQLFAAAALAIGARDLRAQAVTILRGIPSRSVALGNDEVQVDTLRLPEASDKEVVISRIGDRFYWASRGNVELILESGGVFHTFIAVNGSGYIRVLDPALKSALYLPEDQAKEKSFEYVEHLVSFLGSLTYYGKVRVFNAERLYR